MWKAEYTFYSILARLPLKLCDLFFCVSSAICSAFRQELRWFGRRLCFTVESASGRVFAQQTHQVKNGGKNSST